MKKRKAADPVLQKNSRPKKILKSFCLLLLLGAPLTGYAEEEAVQIKPADSTANSPKEALRKQLFGADAGTPGCALIRTTPKNAGGDLDKDLDKFIQELIAAIKARDEMKLQPLFHKRTNTSLAAIGTTYARIGSVVGPPFDVSVYKLWALNTVDGSPKGITCNDEGVIVYPQYGYPLQFGVWLQVLGKTEVGRIYISLVPADGHWNIGSFHFHQWTHAGKDPEAWVKEALKAKAAKDTTGAYMRFDLAKKLLSAGRFLEIPAEKDAESARDTVMSPEDFVKTIRMGATKEEVPSVATLLVVDGVGLLYRFRVPGEISTEDIKSRCKAQAAKVKKEPWAKSLSGVRCSYLLPKEAADKDGVLGGIYFAFSEIK